MTPEIEEKLRLLPDSPGCYLMRSRGEIIYVGKAVNLKNRVRSYFHTRNHTPKVAAMVEHVDDFDTLLCDTELEALILECNLIKLHQPYYNILLRDDKQYPCIRIDEREPYPRAEVVRRIRKDGARYFGPFIGANAIRDTLDALRQAVPLRTCKTLPAVPKRPCLHYEMGQCLAPCAGKTDPEHYHQAVRDAISFLNGNIDELIARLTDEMKQASSRLAFERAAVLRDRIAKIQDLFQRQRAVSAGGGERDVLALAQDGIDAMVEVLHVRDGRVLGGDSFPLEGAGGEDPAEILTQFLLQYYGDAHLPPREILVQASTEEQEIMEQLLSELRGSPVHMSAPQRGPKRALMLMADKNARENLEKRNARALRHAERTTGAAAALGEAVGLARPPRRIEAYDISNTQGTLSVASMVVFIDGVPAKNEYRHYRIKTVVGPNDFASMEEVLGRRFRRGLAEREKALAAGGGPPSSGFGDLPDLILIDGGPEQLLFARRAMQAAGGSVPMFGLAKRLEEIWLPDAETPILLDHHTAALHLIQRIRDEAHRFAITFHRSLRDKNAVHSRLDDIPGIGPKRRTALMRRFKSLQKMREATVDELAETEGMNHTAALALWRALRPDGEPSGPAPAAEKPIKEDPHELQHPED